MVILGIPALQIANKPLLPTMNISVNVSEMTVDIPQSLAIVITTGKDNASISGVSVSVSGAGINLSGVTKNDGNVTFSEVTPSLSGEIIISAQKEGYQSAQISISAKLAEFNVGVIISGKAGVNFQKNIKITVKNSTTGKAVAGAEVTMTIEGALNQALTTSKKGKVSFKFKGIGQLTIQISKKGYLNWSKTYTIQ